MGETKTPFTFPPVHLKSQTYRTLVRFLSQCCQQPQFACPPDDSSGQRHVSGKEADLVVDGNFGAIGVEKRGVNDTPSMMVGTENMMALEEDLAPLQQNDFVADDSACGIGLQDKDLVQAQQLLIHELEHVMKGNEDLVCDNNCGHVITSLDGNQNDGDVVAVSNNQDEHFHLQPIVTEDCRGVGELQVDENFDLSFDNNMSSEISPIDNSEESSLPRNNESEVNHEMQQKEISPKKSVYTSAMVDYPSHGVEHGEIEEGEVSDEFEVDAGSAAAFSEDPVLSQRNKVAEKQASDATVDKTRFCLNDKIEAHKNDSRFSSLMADTVENANARRQMEAKQYFAGEMACKRKVITYEDPIFTENQVRCKKQKIHHGAREQKEKVAAKEQKKDNGAKEQNNEKSDKAAPANQGIALKEKDAVQCNKKKRGPPSKEKKAKKKQKERKKRAEKNRELGVKRLRLIPVLNPKPVSPCHHYLKGRCWEGEKCKFSHDAIPLTKSEPCRFFATHCMKGDNCPFDHELSKYPCKEYVSTGSCSRGDSCMFSHKEDISSTSNVCTLNAKPASVPSSSNSKKLQDISGTSNQSAKASPDSTGVVFDRSPALNGAKTVPDLPTVVPKGIRFLPGGKSSMVETHHPKPSSSSNEGVKAGNQIDRCASVTVQECNEIPKVFTPVAPKGINFLSFGKTPLDKCSGTMKLTSMVVNPGNGVSLFSSKNFSFQKDSSSSSNKDSGVPLGKEANQSRSNMVCRFNEMLHKTEPAVAAFGDASTDSSKRNTQASMPLSLGSGVHTPVHASSNMASNKHQDCSALPWRLPASPLGLGQSSDQLNHAWLKNTPISAQKALASTLSFAAKVGSQMKTKQSTSGACVVSDVGSKDTRSSTMS